MKRWTFKILILLTIFAVVPVQEFHVEGYSLVEKVYAAVRVKGYFRKNGTYVAPHYRSNPDGNPYNNWSFPGNTNPYTGKTATGNPSTYLNNYYNRSTGGSYTGGSYGGSTGGSYTGGSYGGSTYDSTPYCGIFSTWNESNRTCECDSGYLKSGTQCVSTSQYCWREMGYGSSYSGGSCKCDSGYILKGGKCELEFLACGFSERWNSVTKSCECSSGYHRENGYCTYNRTPSVSDTDKLLNDFLKGIENSNYNSQSNSCDAGKFATESHGSTWCCYNGSSFQWKDGKGMCICPSGSVWNTSKTQCIKQTTPKSTYTMPKKEPKAETRERVSCEYFNNRCNCPSGYRQGLGTSRQYCLKTNR